MKYLKHRARPKSFEGLRFSPLETKDSVEPKINCRPDPKLRSPDARNTTVGESSKRYRGLRDPVSCLILFVICIDFATNIFGKLFLQKKSLFGKTNANRKCGQ